MSISPQRWESCIIKVMTKLSKEDVLKLAKLARLKLSDDEVMRFAGEFTEILGYVDLLKDADTEGLKPTYQVNGLTSVTREDELVDYGADQQSLLKNVPHTQDKSIKVQRMIG